jgi:hypothetical protein
MRNRASTANLVLSLAAFWFFMNVIGAALGFGMGLMELGLWLGLLVVGALLIVRRYQRARANTAATNQS